MLTKIYTQNNGTGCLCWFILLPSQSRSMHTILCLFLSNISDNQLLKIQIKAELTWFGINSKHCPETETGAHQMQGWHRNTGPKG